MNFLGNPYTPAQSLSPSPNPVMTPGGGGTGAPPMVSPPQMPHGPAGAVSPPRAQPPMNDPGRSALIQAMQNRLSGVVPGGFGQGRTPFQLPPGLIPKQPPQMQPLAGAPGVMPINPNG